MQRREFIKSMAAMGALALFPVVTACGGAQTEADPSANPAGAGAEGGAASAEGAAADPLAVPLSKPTGWDPLAFNRARGAAGAIPESYMGPINGPGGNEKHLGKHLPYIPALDGVQVPAGFLAIMWGDPAKGYAKHPNAARSDERPEGHWYNSIRVRKATEEAAEELESAYADWPGTPEMAEQYRVFGGGDIQEDGGRNTIYLVALPADVKPGDEVRIHAHCLTHGEYVDFLTI